MSSTSGTPAEQSGQGRWPNDINGPGEWRFKNRPKPLTDSFGPKSLGNKLLSLPGTTWTTCAFRLDECIQIEIMEMRICG